MGAVSDAVSSVGDAVSGAVSSVGNAVADVGNAVVKEVVKPVVKAVDNTVKAAIADPVGTAVKVAAIASGNPLLVAAANTAVAVAHGADINTALESGAKAGLTSFVAGEVGKAVNTPAVGSVNGPDNIDVGGGFNPATGASSVVVPTPPPATTAGNIAKNTTAGIIQGKDPLSALISGGISGGTSAITANIPDWDKLTKAQQAVVNNTVSTALQGGNASQALVDSALSAGIAEAKAQYNSSGLKAGDTGKTESVFDPTFGGAVSDTKTAETTPPSGTQIASTDNTLPTVSVSGSPIYAESSSAGTVKPPFGYELMPASLADARPEGAYYDQFQNAWLMPNKEAEDLQAKLLEQPNTTTKEPVVAVPEPLDTVNNGDGTVTQYMSDGSVRAIDLNTGTVTPVASASNTGSSGSSSGASSGSSSDVPTSDMGEIVVTDKKDPYTGDIQMDLSGTPVVTPTVTPAPLSPTAPANTAPLSTATAPAPQSTLQKIAQADASTTSGFNAITSPIASFLTSKQVKSDFQDPLSALYRLQNPSVANENANNSTNQSFMSSPFYNYGKTQSIDDVLGITMASGGLATPLMASGGATGTRHGKYAHGGLSTPVIEHSGKMRVDFRSGDAVTGAGDGQSDDIPAMLADGEFVFPADVVAAIGNGSTKAGSDKLYDMMHGIRSHVRSAKPQDLPPEIKSPLDFLKTKRKKARS